VEQTEAGPLAGLRICDLSTVLAGPYCTMVLSDLGAEVVKVEPPEGDATRAYGPPWVGEGLDRTAAYFLSVNRNKRSVRLDLRTPGGREILARLIARSDALVENFRPGGLERLGFDDARLAELNPRLVRLSITGYGPDGPDAAKPGYDFIAQAVGGLMAVTGFAAHEGGQPTKVGVAISDIVTGLLGAIGLLAALREGRAQRVDVSLLESTLAVLINQAQNALVTGQSPQRRGNAHPNIVPYETFDTADGEIAVAVGSERQWHRLCAALDVLEIADDPRFADNGARVRHRDELRPLLAERFSSASAADWLRRLDDAGVPCGPVNDVLGALRQPQAKARGMEQQVEHPRLGTLTQVGVAINLSGGGSRIRSAPPLLGADTEAVLRDLGYAPAEIDALRAEAAI
jgi:crotonobetainyl-CoA:carnitine CoA-transferase CaiB-like acyl-CoA transferase